MSRLIGRIIDASSPSDNRMHEPSMTNQHYAVGDRNGYYYPPQQQQFGGPQGYGYGGAYGAQQQQPPQMMMMAAQDPYDEPMSRRERKHARRQAKHAWKAQRPLAATGGGPLALLGGGGRRHRRGPLGMIGGLVGAAVQAGTSAMQGGKMGDLRAPGQQQQQQGGQRDIPAGAPAAQRRASYDHGADGYSSYSSDEEDDQEQVHELDGSSALPPTYSEATREEPRSRSAEGRAPRRT